MTPHGKEVLRKTFIKKGDAWATISPLGEMISLMKYPPSRTVFWVGCIFSLGCRTRAWHRNWGLIIEKWAFRNFQGWPKKDKMRIDLAILFQIYTGILSTWNTTKYFTYTTANPDLLRIRTDCVVRPVSKFIISKSTTLHVHLIVLSTFHCHHRTITTWKCLISRFIEDLNKPGRAFFLFEFAYIWQNKRFVIIGKSLKECELAFH